MKNIIKIGFDVHGVINKNPNLFRKVSRLLRSRKHQVHILTGKEICSDLLHELSTFEIEYDYIYSITSYHKSLGTYITYKDGDLTQPLIAPPKWNRSKADYAKEVGLNIHIDDSAVYGEYFDHNTLYIIYNKEVDAFLEALIC